MGLRFKRCDVFMCKGAEAGCHVLGAETGGDRANAVLPHNVGHVWRRADGDAKSGLNEFKKLVGQRVQIVKAGSRQNIKAHVVAVEPFGQFKHGQGGAPGD